MLFDWDIYRIVKLTNGTPMKHHLIEAARAAQLFFGADGRERPPSLPP